jgi:phosphoribosylformylglycinamidine synthase subunit PurQ / glutaminase
MASPQPRIGVVMYPGSNDDHDALWALSALDAESIPVWHEERELPDLDAVVLPGGFSYGDYLRCGAIARFSPATTAVKEFADAGGLVLGICNGFQVLCEAGLLPGILLQNESLRFICRDVPLVVERDDLPFTSRCTQGQQLVIPVKHGDGRWFAPPELVAKLEANRQVVLRYGEACNGSVDDIAGVCNERGNVLGLMPHPENHVEAAIGPTDGRGLFAGLTQHFAKVA